MTKEELANKLHGRQYTEEISHAEAAEAKKAGLVVIFGASDDLCELRGAIDDELDACNGRELFIGKDGKLIPDIDEDEIATLKKHGAYQAILAERKAATKIEAKWCDEPGYSWIIKTAAPHAAFHVMEDGEAYCRGIVIDLKELN